MAEIKKLYSYFRSIYPQLKAAFPNMFVVINNTHDTHVFESYSEAIVFATREYGRGKYLLQPI